MSRATLLSALVALTAAAAAPEDPYPYRTRAEERALRAQGLRDRVAKLDRAIAVGRPVRLTLMPSGVIPVRD